jgi:hypothetical protein
VYQLYWSLEDRSQGCWGQEGQPCGSLCTARYRCWVQVWLQASPSSCMSCLSIGGGGGRVQGLWGGQVEQAQTKGGQKS